MTKLLFKSSIISNGNMSFRRGNPDEALQNRLNFFKQNNLDYKNVIGMSPAHTNGIKIVTSKNKSEIIDKTDGLITVNPEIVLFTLTGDCIPLAVSTNDQSIIGLFHISWKNANNDFPKTIVNEFLNLKSNILNLTIGPSICSKCYVVKDPSQKNDPKWKPYLTPLPTTYPLQPTYYSIDLRQMVTDRFIELGIPPSHIKNLNLCTIHTNNYFSHHRATQENLEHDYRFGTILTIQ